MIDLQPDLELTRAEAERILEAWLGRPVTCSGIDKLEGGLVNSTFALEFDEQPHRAVIKLHGSGGDSFNAEARSLDYLREQTSCPVPRVYLVDGSARLVPHAFLLMERVPGVCLEGLDLEPGERRDVDVQLGEVLADLHEHTGTHWGGIDDGAEARTWPELFRDRLRTARSHPMIDQRLPAHVRADIEHAIELTGSALDEHGVPTLVHGDVWDGNLMVQQVGAKWRLTGLLDPDLQFADVEYELAYLQVFDGSPDAVFAAYAEHRPLRPGYEHRRLFYWLHTALIHVALFGGEYFCDFTARIAKAIGGLKPA